MMGGIFLTAEEWDVLTVVAAGGKGPFRAPPYGRLVMRAFVKVDADGNASVTEQGIAVLVGRMEELAGCLEGSKEEVELERIAGAVDVACELVSLCRE